MPISNVLESQAKAQGITVSELVRRAVGTHKTAYRAAIALGVYPNTIRWHMERKEGGKPTRDP